MVGRGTALSVAGVSICLLGLIFGLLGGWGLLIALIAGVMGVAVSFSGVVDEHESAGT